MNTWAWMLVVCAIDIAVCGYLIFQQQPGLVIALILGVVLGLLAAFKVGAVKVKELERLRSL